MIDFFKARTNSEFDIAESYRSYAINDIWKSNVALWNLIGAYAGEASSKLYERIVDMTKNISDVDICDIRQLESLSYQLGLKSGFGFIDSLPSEIYDLINVLSVKQSYFFAKNGIFTESGLSTITDSIPSAIEEICSGTSANVVVAVKTIVSSVVSAMVTEGTLTETQKTACQNAVNNGGSINSLESLIYTGDASEMPSDKITDDNFTEIKVRSISELLNSGKISYDDYKSSSIHGTAFKDALNVNLRPAIEFNETVRNNAIVVDYTVNHSLRAGTQEELTTFLNTENGKRFNASIWNLSKNKLNSVVSNSDISSSAKSGISSLCGDSSVSGSSLVLHHALVNETISRSEFTIILNDINSMTLYQVLQSFIDDSSNGLSTLATNMKNSGIITASGTASEFVSYVNSKGLEKAIDIMSGLSKISVDKFADKSISWLYSHVTYINTMSSLSISSGEAKIPNNSNVIAVFNNNVWLIFNNLWNKFPGLESVENSDIKSGNYVQFTAGADTLQLPATGLTNMASVVGASVSFETVPLYIGFQVFINKIIYQSYHDLLKEKMSCVLNAGNESDLSLYKEDYLKYVTESGFDQYTKDKNINFDFYRALVISNFCSNFCTNRNLVGDWFLDSTLHNSEDANRIDAEDVISDVSKTLCDMTISITIRREILKKLAIQYSKIGSNAGVEKTIGDFVLRNFTKRADDWNFSSNTAVVNDAALPLLSDIRRKFETSVTEYYDNNEYLNISAESAKKTEFDGYDSTVYISSNIDASGHLTTGLLYKRTPHYSETNIPLVSGGNSKFWEELDYSVRVSELEDDIVEFYKNVDGCLDELSSIISLSALATTLWNNCSLSSLSSENLEMHKKYIGDGTGYSTAVNCGNQNYPTIAPLESIVNLTEVYGNMERDYQSVMNDDRPDIVEGVAAVIISAYSCVPVTTAEQNTNVEIIGVPPFFTYPAADYIRDAVYQEARTGTRAVPHHSYSTTKTSSVEWKNVQETVYVPSSVSTQQLSSWQSLDTITHDDYIPSIAGQTVGIADSTTRQSIPIVITDDKGTEQIIDDIMYNIYGTLSNSAVEMSLTSVKISYEEAAASTTFNHDAYLNTLTQKYTSYTSSEDLNGGAYELSGVSAGFGTLRNSINSIDVGWYTSNLIVDSIVNSTDGAYVSYPVSNTVTYTYTDTDTAIYSKTADGIGTPTPVSTYAQVKTYIQSATNSLKAKLSVSDRSTFANYSNAVIEGKITNQDSSQYMVKYMGWLQTSMNRLQYIDSLSNLRSTIDGHFDQVTSRSTLANYETYRTTINSMVSYAGTWNTDVTTYYNNSGKQSSTTIVKDLDQMNDSLLSELFGSDISKVHKATNTIDLYVTHTTVEEAVTVQHSAYVTVTTQIQVPSSVTNRVSSIKWTESTNDDVYYVNEQYTYFVDVPYQITSYKIVDSNSLDSGETETTDMFDIYGGLINSWRNVNVELKGYQSCYEASPNLNKNYTEQKYVDVDGPWIGEALYDLLYQIIPLSGATVQDRIVTPDPVPESIDLFKLKSEHYYDSSNGIRSNKWWLPEYINSLGGHDLEKQIVFYVNKIVECRNKAVFEVEADSFNNQYTLYKNKSEQNKYDAEGVLWMRHDGFPFSFPIMEKPYDGWENSATSMVQSITDKNGTYYRYSDGDNVDKKNGNQFAWVNNSLAVTMVYTQRELPNMYDKTFRNDTIPTYESTIMSMDMKQSQEAIGNNIDQIYLGYTMNNYRSLFNRCIAFGVNNSTLWAAGYDGKNSDGTDHFNIRIIQLKYFTTNGIRFYGTRNPRTMNSFNSDPTGYNSTALVTDTNTPQYNWIDFCGGYYDGNVINFVFYGKSGFRFRVYNLSNARLNVADIVAEFDSSTSAGSYTPTIVNNHNPFRLVEDNSYCYIGWVSGDKVVVCQNDKKNYVFENCLAWNIPSTETSREIDSLVAGTCMVKVKMKSGNVYYGRISQSGFYSNSGVEDLYPVSDMILNYIVDDSEDDVKTKIPTIPIKDITQWRHWSYSLTDNSLLTISYSDSLNVKAETSAAVTKEGIHYNIMSKNVYIPGNCMEQSVVAYDPNSGIDESTGVKVLTGYEIGLEINQLTPYLQSVVPAYAPAFMSGKITPMQSDYDMAQMAHAVPVTLTQYYGLPYNNIYAERTDLEDNSFNQTDSLGPNTQMNFMSLKNFYNYAYEHEYNWNNAVTPYDQTSINSIVGWRRYNKCSISRYSDSMWLSYNYIRDYTILSQSNKQQSVAYVMNDYEFVELIYGTIQLMNTNYCKSNVFSISINNAGFNMQGYSDTSEEIIQKRENVKAQITDEVREMIDDYSPAHMQLWKVNFKN